MTQQYNKIAGNLVYTLENYGDVALLDKELDLQRIERELEETAAFIAEAEARKAAI